jgi:hypothetical protein
MMTLTRDIARAASQDTGNRSMRKAGRTAWNEDDYSAACAEFNRLWPEPHNLLTAAFRALPADSLLSFREFCIQQGVEA